MTPLGDLILNACADLAHRRSVATIDDLVFDEVVNHPLSRRIKMALVPALWLPAVFAD